MKKLFLASIFLIIDLEYEASFGTVGILPKFVGYLLLVVACREYKKYSEKFSGVIIPAIVMVGISLASYLLNLTGHIVSSTSILLNQAILTIGFFFVSLKLMQALKDLQISNHNEETEYNYQRTFYVWIVFCIAKLLSIVLAAANSAFTIVFLCLSLVTGFALLVFFYANNELYDFDNFKQLGRKRNRKIYTAGEPIIVLLIVVVVWTSFIYPRLPKKGNDYVPEYGETFTLSFVEDSKSVDSVSIKAADKDKIINLVDFNNHSWKKVSHSAGSTNGYYVYYNSSDCVIWIPTQTHEASGKSPIFIWDKQKDYYREAYYDIEIRNKIQDILAAYL